MATEEANPDQDALIEKVRSQVQHCKLVEAILVDDQLDTSLTAARWNEAVGYLQSEDPPEYTKLRRFLSEKGTGKIDELPSEENLPEAIRQISSSKSVNAARIVTEKRFREQSLEHLAAILSEIGLKLSFHTGVTPETPPRSGQLYFLDYRMQGDDKTAGIDASRLLGELVNRPGDSPPPAAVLMSRGLDKRPTQSEWELVARNAGYYRFNFRYLDKKKLDGAKMPFLFFLHELLSALPLGTVYYSQLKNLKKAANTAAELALARIRQLSPAEFSIFAVRHLGDGSGRKATRHVLDMYLGLLDAEVKDNPDLEASFRTFAEMLQSSPMLATTDSDIHTFHELHNRLLYDRSRWVVSGPVEFGDMYCRPREPNVYYLVLTPECDLELRHKDGVWAPKAEDVLMLRGEVSEKKPEKAREDIVGKPFVSSAAPLWITWLLRKRVIVPTKNLMPGDVPAVAAESAAAPNNDATATQLKKWGRLRQADAEQIQQWDRSKKESQF